MKKEGTLQMSRKERDRLRILGMAKGCKITAAGGSGVGPRYFIGTEEDTINQGLKKGLICDFCP